MLVHNEEFAQPNDGRQPAGPSADDAEDEFHDAAESEDSFEDATEHFDVGSLPGPHRAAPAHADLPGGPLDSIEAAQHGAQEAAQLSSAHLSPWSTAVPPETEAEAAEAPEAAQAPSPGAAASSSGWPTQQADSFDDDSWPLNHRFREPRVAQPTEAEAEAPDGAEATAGAAEAGAALEAGAEAAPEETLSPEEIQERTAAAETLKQDGNSMYAEGKNEEARAKYSEALDAAPPAAPQRAVYYANRAAAALRLQQWSDAAADCTAALAVDGSYVKAYLRRAAAYEHSDDLERALADYKKVLELEPGSSPAAGKALALEPVVQERREKMKEEMIGKLKELGNTVLGKFGMSLDNFKAVKDPSTGAYSINFSQ